MLLFEVVASCKYHRWQQAIEENLFVEVNLLDAATEGDYPSKNEADQYACASLVQDVYLYGGVGTCLC